jgi:hypothetical protein
MDGRGNVVPQGYPVETREDIEILMAGCWKKDKIPKGTFGIISDWGGSSPLDFFLVVKFLLGDERRGYVIHYEDIGKLALGCPAREFS